LEKIPDFWEKNPDFWKNSLTFGKKSLTFGKKSLTYGKKYSLTFGSKQNPSLFFRTIHYFYLGRIHDFREKIPIIRAKLPNSLNPKIK
jgi:hypothetical protein